MNPFEENKKLLPTKCIEYWAVQRFGESQVTY
jgi:hypothetical protein